MGLVKAGLGVAIVPGYATALADPAFVSWSRLERPVIEREVFRVHRSGPSLSPSVQAFHSFVLEQLGLELAGVAAEVGNPNTRSKVHVKVKV